MGVVGFTVSFCTKRSEPRAIPLSNQSPKWLLGNAPLAAALSQAAPPYAAHTHTHTFTNAFIRACTHPNTHARTHARSFTCSRMQV